MVVKRNRGFWRWLKYHYLKLVRINETPEKIAGGVSLGVVLGILPTFGLAVIIAVLLAGAFRVNKVSAVIGTLVMNPWTTPFFWALSYLTGSLVLGENLHDTINVIKAIRTHADLWHNLLAQKLLLPYIVGNVIVTAWSAASAYIVVLYVVREYRKAKKRRHPGRPAST